MPNILTIHSQPCQENYPLVTYPFFLAKNYQIYLPFWSKYKTLKARMIIYLKSSLSITCCQASQITKTKNRMQQTYKHTHIQTHRHTQTLCTDLPEQNMHGSEAPEIETLDWYIITLKYPEAKWALRVSWGAIWCLYVLRISKQSVLLSLTTC